MTRFGKGGFDERGDYLMRNEYKELLKYSKIIKIDKSNHILNYYKWTLHITEGERQTVCKLYFNNICVSTDYYYDQKINWEDYDIYNLKEAIFGE